MQENSLFQKTRLRLALWYAGVMGLILGLCGLGLYEAIAHAHWMTQDREINSVAGTLHDSLEPVLKIPGRLEPDVDRFLPDLCVARSSGDIQCSIHTTQQRHVIGAIHQGIYYVKLSDLSGKIIATAGSLPQGKSPAIATIAPGHKFAAITKFTDGRGTPYLLISIMLHTQNQQNWGYLQVGRSIQDAYSYLFAVKLVIILGLPLALLAVGVASWFLAGLAIQPIYLSYRQVQQFTADAAHELRTPLAAIRATVETTIISKNSDDFATTAATALESIERQNHRLSELVQDLLLLARMDRQELPLTPNSPSKRDEGNRIKYIPCCLQDIIADLEEEIAALALEAEVNLTADIRSPEPLEVMGDYSQLYRILFNLASNAIHYTPPGGKVTIILENRHPWAVIQVMDNGIGIATEELGRIFDRFYRVQSDRSRASGGAGLGLAIARRLAQAHHSTITVQSQLGKGSTFTVRLPLQKTCHQ
ncbi:MAG TPA: two-component sensor histidine kinase [Oscillatoriaceae cyanobacterium M33_DOE_052]|uniref:histidine kinase n=1 Tax=Planktothricoides sp. SpSt-374 TaxID=2282167 RepID=A0A7C3ZNJ7_9CYAN|nr:two-component sensor histidine kinase [Oscillatoriaceae cyanobacterium M33_DOE_052]